MISIKFFFVALLPSMAVAGGRNIYEILDRRSAYDTLTAALELTGLDEVLKGHDDYTVLAPTDTAFRSLLRELGVSSLSDIDEETLTDVLLYHVIPGKVRSSDLSNTRVKTEQGSKVKVRVNDHGVTFDDRAMVLEADIRATNGIIHKIDAVLLPGSSGGGSSRPNLVDIIDDDSRLDNLFDCVVEAGLGEAIADSDDITIFAPTDSAFRDLFHELHVENCGDIDDTELLTDILLYHVVPVEAGVADISDGDILPTLLEDEELEIDFRNNRAFVNDARIVDVDIKGKNGIIHIINKVLLPF